MSVIVRAESIVKTYSLHTLNDTPVLRGVSFDIHRGEFVTLIGPSGAGKSTLLHIAGTLDTPDSGTVTFASETNEQYVYQSMSAEQRADVRNKHIGFIFQFHHLLPEFTAIENVMIPAMIAGHSQKASLPLATELLERVGIRHRADHKPSELSGGEQQRIAIARALINKPNILFADEPTGNLDTANTQAVLELLSSLRKEYKLTLVVATHSAEVASAADRVISMKDGLILA